MAIKSRLLRSSRHGVAPYFTCPPPGPSQAKKSATYGPTCPLLLPPHLPLSSKYFLCSCALCGLSPCSQSFISPGRDAPLLPFHPINFAYRSLRTYFSFPSSLRFLSTSFHPSSVSPWRGASPVAVDADGAGCTESVSTSAYIECIRVGAGGGILGCFACWYWV